MALQWQGEYIDASGTPKDVISHWFTLDQVGLTRNPKMPLIWSYPGKLYGP
jgi:hypothetical protein